MPIVAEYVVNGAADLLSRLQRLIIPFVREPLNFTD